MSATETITQPMQPDIQYHPDFAKYQDRTRRRKETETLETTLPAGFPSQLESSLVWEGKDVEKRSDWVYELSGAQLDEIDAALKSFKGERTSHSQFQTSRFANCRSPEQALGTHQPVHLSSANYSPGPEESIQRDPHWPRFCCSSWLAH